MLPKMLSLLSLCFICTLLVCGTVVAPDILGIVQPSQLPSRAASAVPVHGNIRLERPRQPRIESFPEGCLGILKGGSLPGGVDVRLHKRRPSDGQEPVRTAVRHFAEVVSLGVV